MEEFSVSGDLEFDALGRHDINVASLELVFERRADDLYITKSPTYSYFVLDRLGVNWEMIRPPSYMCVVKSQAWDYFLFERGPD